MQIFLFINGNDQYRIIRIQQTLCDLQSFLHKRQPFAVAVFVCTIHIIVVILPVFSAGIVGRVYKNANFDTNRKSLLRHISAEKGLK